MEDLKIKTCEIHSGNLYSEWCSYCNQALCKACLEYHKQSKVSKLHDTIPIENYVRLPNIVQCINRTCELHNDTVEFYCDMHEVPCCFHCINDSHKLCRDIVPLIEITKRKINNVAMEDMQNKLKEMSGKLNDMITSRRENINLLKKQETRSITKIKQIRNEMTSYLDKLEKQAIAEIKDTIEEKKSGLENIIDELYQHKEENNRLNNDIDQILTFADNLQKLMSSKYLANNKQTLDVSLKSMQMDRRFFDVEVLFDEAVSIKTFQLNYQSLGYVTVLEKPNVFTLNAKQVQESTDIPDRSVNDSEHLVDSWVELEDKGECMRQRSRNTAGSSPMTLSDDLKLKTIDVKAGGGNVQITACKLLPNGDVLLLDWGRSCLVLVDKDCMLRKEIPFFSAPYDFVYIEGDVVAVTLRSINAVSVVKIKSAKEMKRYKTQHYCYGIAYKQDQLYVSLPHLCLVQVFDYKTGEELEKVKTPHPAFNIDIMGDKLYCTSHKDSLIFCCSLKGDITWKLRQPSLKEPFCISADPRGYAYVACRKQSKIIRITSDGKIGRVFNCAYTGLSRPRAVEFCRDSTYLLICAEESLNYVKVSTDMIF